MPGPCLDNELENVQRSVGQTIDALKDVRRSDGKLSSGVVTRVALDSDLAGSIGPDAMQAALDAAAARDATEGFRDEGLTALNQTELARDAALASETAAAVYAGLAGAMIYDFGTLQQAPVGVDDWETL